MNQPDILQEMRARLAALVPVSLEIRDDSAAHAGHAGSGGGGHFHIRIVSAQFAGKSAVTRHRLVYQALQPLLADRIHALSITALAPDET